VLCSGEPPKEEKKLDETSDDGEVIQINNDYDPVKHLGLSLDLCYHRVVRPKKEKGSAINCPFITCGRAFVETGNLKTHMRIHVSNHFFSFIL